MKKKDTQSEVISVPVVASFTAAQKTASQFTLTLGASHIETPQERRRLRRELKTIPDGLVSGVLQLAELHGGTILGLTVAVEPAREVLASSTVALGFAEQLRAIASGIEDGALQRRSTLAERTEAIYQSIRAVNRTPEGKALQGELNGLRAMRPTRRRASKPAAAPPSGTATTTPTQPATASPATEVTKPTT